jgi:hypothetical protein
MVNGFLETKLLKNSGPLIRAKQRNEKNECR